jgi:tetratricopeptide (TPR) repeat protein
VVLADACQWEPPVGKGYFDALVFADVLEHLADPDAVLKRYLPWLKPAGVVILSIPNVRFWAVVQHLAEGCWTYQDEGILDRRHLRFFTWKEAARLLEMCGLEPEVVRWNSDPRCPQVPAGKTVDLDLGRVTIRAIDDREIQEFFVFQYLVRAVRNRAALLSEVRLLESAGRNSEAFWVLSSLAERSPDDVELLKKMLGAGRKEAEKDKALEMVEESLRLHPANTDLLLAAAGAFLEERLYERAEECLERVLLFDPARLEALSLQYRLRKLRASGPPSLSVHSREDDRDQPRVP